LYIELNSSLENISAISNKILNSHTLMTYVMTSSSHMSSTIRWLWVTCSRNRPRRLRRVSVLNSPEPHRGSHPVILYVVNSSSSSAGVDANSSKSSAILMAYRPTRLKT